MKIEQSVPKRRHTKFRRRGITQKKAYNFSIVMMRLDEAMKQFTVNVGTPIQESPDI